MALDPEALAQLARLLGDNALRTSTLIEVRAAASADIERLAAGLVAEAAASDDVTDRQTALDFVESRIEFFNDLLEDDVRTRLRTAVQDKIDTW